MSDDAKRATSDSEESGAEFESPERQNVGGYRWQRERLKKLGFSTTDINQLNKREYQTLATWLAPDQLRRCLSVLIPPTFVAFIVAQVIHSLYFNEEKLVPALYMDLFEDAVAVSAIGLFMIYVCFVFTLGRWADRDRQLGLSIRELILEAKDKTKTPVSHRRDLARLARRVRTRAKRAGVATTMSSGEIFEIINAAPPWGTVAERAIEFMLRHLKGETLDPERLIGYRSKRQTILESPVWGGPWPYIGGVLAGLGAILAAVSQFVEIN